MLNFNIHIFHICCQPGIVLGVVNQSDTSLLLWGDLEEETQEMEPVGGVVDAVVGRKKGTWGWCPPGFKKSFQKPPE